MSTVVPVYLWVANMVAPNTIKLKERQSPSIVADATRFQLHVHVYWDEYNSPTKQPPPHST